MRLQNSFFKLSLLIWIAALPAGAMDVNDPAYLKTKTEPVVDFSKTVQIDNLPDININSIGTHRTLPPDLWKNSNSKTLTDLIKQTVVLDLSPAARRIFINMLLTDTTGSDSLAMDTRIKGLNSLGAFDKTIALIEMIPPERRSDAAWRDLFTALFLSGQVQAACDLAEKTPKLAKTADEMRLACAVGVGDKTKAELIFATHKEAGDLDKTSVLLGENLLQGAQNTLPPKTVLTTKHIHMAAALGDQVDWDSLKLSRPIKKALSALPTMPLHKRLEYAQTSGVTPEQLAALYWRVKGDESDNPIIHRAWLYQQMATEKDPTKRAQYINDFLESARGDGLFVVLAGMAEPFLNILTPAADQINTAFNAVQVYALSDNLSMAYPWFKLLERAQETTYQNQALLLAPLLNKLGAGMPMNTDAILKTCAKKQTPYCRQFLARAPDFFVVDNAALALNKRGVSYAYPPIAGGALEKLIQDKKTGEAFLRALLAIGSSDSFEPEIIKAFETIRPVSLTKGIITEQYIYQ